MDLRNLRRIMEGTYVYIPEDPQELMESIRQEFLHNTPTPGITWFDVLAEAALNDDVLNEAYFGKDACKGIEKIMNRIEQKILANPLVDICKEPEGPALDKELCKVFGFKSAHVYWNNDPNMGGIGPCTLPAARGFSYNENFKYGSFKKGFYDKGHTMVVFVNMDTALVTQGHLTGAEMTAVLIHELGHNFDYTPWALMGSYVSIINNIIDAILSGRLDQLLGVAFGALIQGTDQGRHLYMEVMNLVDTCTKMLPPLNVIAYATGWTVSAVIKVLNMILVPFSFARIPMQLLYMPISYLQNFFTRKSETYADSLAAAYGYGPEQVSALEKLQAMMLTFNNAPRGVFAIFDNMTLLYQEIGTLAKGGHGSNQQRALRMMDSLKESMKDPRLDAATKKEIQKEYNRLKQTYDAIIMMDDDQRKLLTQLFRKVIDVYYTSTGGASISSSGKETTYAN